MEFEIEIESKSVTQSNAKDPSFGVKMELEKELTKKFLCGEMSFADYSNEWYYNDDEDGENVEIDKEYEYEEGHQSTTSKDKHQQRRRRFTHLPPALLGLMGEANLRFARGDKETAEQMCHEIIKQVPTASEPYQTLAQIYESDADKTLQFSLLAAHLSRSDANEWLRLATICSQRQEIRQEMSCYNQAIKADPQNLSIHLKRLELLTEIEEQGNIPIHTLSITRVKCYHKIVSCMKATDGDTIMKYARLAAKIYHSNNEIERMLQVFGIAYKKCSSLFTLEDVNIFLEALISLKQFETCLEIFVAVLGVVIEAEINTIKNSNGVVEEQTTYTKCQIPNDLPIDLKTKLLVCFIHLGATNLVKMLLDDFLSHDVEKAGDLYMDIEEALSSVGHHELAMQVLEPLVKNTSFDLGAVWLKHADCLYNLGREDDSIHSYYKVLKHAPQHPDARCKLYSLLEKKGCIDEALDILQQDYKYVVSAALFYEHCCALKRHGRLLKYLEVGEALLSKKFVRFRHPGELSIACKLRGGIDLVHEFRTLRGENPYHEMDLHFDEDESFKLTPQQEWDLFVELLKIALQFKKYTTMMRLSFGAMMSKSLTPYRLDMEFYCLQACILNNEQQYAIKFAREFTQKYPGSRSWNMLNYAINSAEESIPTKFLWRLFNKDYNIVKNLFLGNNFLASGRYLVALKYFLEYHDQCREPLSALLIAVCILAMAVQKTVDKHHNLVLQGISYLLKYKSLRKCDQEVYYNLGRAYQMLSINHLAIEYYERALACKDVTQCDQHGVIDLTKETAFNLYLLYRDHSPDIARKYILKYIVI